MDKMKIKGEDMTSTINYCLWDAYALTLVMKKIQFLGSVKANVEIFNIPLSWALFKNATNWITMFMLRSFYKQGFAFSYAKFDMPATRTKFRGATTEECPSHLQLAVLIAILMGDYESLYPNSIILANMGIDSIIDHDNGNCYKININFVDKYLVEKVRQKLLLKESITKKERDLIDADDNPKYVYFSKDPSLYAEIVKNVLDKRLSTKASMKGTKGLEYAQLDAR